MVKRAFKYRFYPSFEQEQLLAQTFGCVRVAYNQVLRWRTDAFHNDQQKIGYTQASAKLTELKRLPEFEWLNDVSCVPLQQSLRHQQAAFKNFFEGRAGYPQFKKKRDKQSAEFTKSGFQYRDGELTIAKCKEPLYIRWSREPSSKPSSITITKDSAGRYFVSMLCEFEPKRLPVVNQTVGIDLGITDLFVTDKGEKVGNPRHTKKYATQLTKAQRRLSKKKLGSRNRAKAKLKVARVHAKISDCRQDGLHKLSRRLINDNQVVCVETLKVKNMVRNPKLSKAISDCGWGEFARQLAYKAEWAGRDLVAIDQWFPSSKRCSCCGHTVKSLPLDVRRWQCPECDTSHDRDTNAAINIKAVGHAVLALGENVSLVSPVGISCSR
jgi:putative transposase